MKPRKILITLVIFVVFFSFLFVAYSYVVGRPYRLAQEVSDNYIKYIESDQFAKAYSLYGDAPRANNSVQLFIKQTGPSLKTKLKGKRCGLQSRELKVDVIYLTYLCSGANSKTLTIEYLYRKNDSSKIYNIDWDGKATLSPVSF